jgi:hypothetical protein
VPLEAIVDFFGEIINFTISISMREENSLLAKTCFLINDITSGFLINHKDLIF